MEKYDACYELYIVWNEETQHYQSFVPAVGVMGIGATESEALDAVLRLAEQRIEYLASAGLDIPPSDLTPSSADRNPYMA